MSIGTGIVLFVIGAILAFAIDVEVSWADLDMIGYILMGAGAVVFVIGLIFLMRRRQTSTVTQTSVDPSSGTQTTRRSTSAPDDPAGL
ncbi:MAG TPA: hypothetical protein IAA98_14085 [Candidatus Avipropionibacterium avicola]|uniref:DUF6458 domain-containing protein n=1 Tax=Candidatus Avipropionibacterium avicola TaxID=2840701 RepID=A0A9D1H0D6_9ACTN|nr:hypothetical protein [Candidatus Avipropionibacterium avicola]